ncbi:conserved hypothetical protein [Ricinus communis]|uniref:Uncharacterized protein n=1 Tax=Ricinus communis TaxID=3988 RepID=B9SQX7_RICCO|nr:conserved hypothetical protein [Ricinus communis]
MVIAEHWSPLPSILVLPPPPMPKTQLSFLPPPTIALRQHPTGNTQDKVPTETENHQDEPKAITK